MGFFVQQPGRLLAICLSIVCLWHVRLSPANARTDPERQWFTITSSHFHVHSYDGGEELARRVAMYAEEAYMVLNPFMGWSPEEHVQIVLTDSADVANGYASVLPYNTITIHAYPPSADGELGDFDDWLRLLVLHEYAHILHLDQVSGFPKFLNTLLGKTFQPNTWLPRWLVEGVATWVEGQLTSAGRPDSARFRMYLRTAALANVMPTLGELTGSPLMFPRNTSWYLYGSRLVDYMVRNASQEALRRFMVAYGRRVVPFGINIVAGQTTGKTLGQWHGDMLDEVRRVSTGEAVAIESDGLREGRRITSGGEEKRSPRYSPDGRYLAYISDTGHSLPELVRSPVETPEDVETIIRCRGGCGSFDFSRDGRDVVLTTGRYHREVNLYTDLIRQPFGENQDIRQAERVTEGGRVSSPATSSDGKEAWVVRTSWGKTWLAAVSLVDGCTRRLWRPKGYARLDHPTVIPGGRGIVLSMHAGGTWDLYRVVPDPGGNATALEVERLTHGASIELHPHVTADGRWLLYASDAGGVYNIYAREIDGGATRQLTNVVSGAFEPRVSPDGRTFVYVGWTAQGDELYEMAFKPEQGTPFPVLDPRPGRVVSEPRPTALARRPYSPLSTLTPRQLGLHVLASTEALRLGVSIGATDVSNRLRFGLSLELDPVVPDINAAFTLGVGLGWPDLSFTAGRYSWEQSRYSADRVSWYREEVYHAAAELELPLSDVFVPMTFAAAWSAEMNRSLDDTQIEHSPDSYEPVVPTDGVAGTFKLSWSLGDTESYLFSISPQRGGYARFRFRLSHGLTGKTFMAWRFNYEGKRYITMPWHPDHVLLIGLRGGWRGGDEDSVGTFTLGGIPAQDVLSDLIQNERAGAHYLRGYRRASFEGTSYHLATMEYRLPLWRVRWGLDTLPLFIEDISGAFFVDAGLAYGGEANRDIWRSMRAGVGVEVRLSLELLYGVHVHFRLGYARGLGPEGVDQVYLLLAPQP